MRHVANGPRPPQEKSRFSGLKTIPLHGDGDGGTRYFPKGRAAAKKAGKKTAKKKATKRKATKKKAAKRKTKKGKAAA